MTHLPRKILLATDGSEDAELVELAAASLSVGAGAELHIVHAWQSVPHPLVDADSFEEEAARILKVQANYSADRCRMETDESLCFRQRVCCGR
jgi:hypothetical protein